MPRGNWGNSEQHRKAGKMSSGNRSRGTDRKGGRKKGTKNKYITMGKDLLLDHNEIANN